MIPKIHTGSNVTGMVLYNSRKIEDIKDKTRAQFLGVRNIIGETNDDIIKAITNRNLRNGIVKSPNLHISLNFPEGDILDNEKMLIIADDYMNQMNYSDQPYAIYRHYDRKHPHIHIVSTQIDISGKKINDSNLFYRSSNIARKIEKKYDLKIATKSQSRDVETEINNADGIIDYINISMKNVLLDKPTNFYQLDMLLKLYSINRIEEEGGMYFEFDKSNIEDTISNKIININSLDLNYNKAFFLNEFKINNIDKEKYIKQVQAKIYDVKNKIKERITLDDLKTEFKKKGLIFKAERIAYGQFENQINKIFITDSKSKITYSASDLNIRTKDFVKKFILDESISREEVKNIKTILSLDNDSIHRFDPVEDFEIKKDVFDDVLFLLSQTIANSEDDILLLKKKRKKRKKK